MTVFNINRKHNYGPNVETTPTFDPFNCLCSPGVAGAIFGKERWEIEVEDIAALQRLAERHGAISVVFQKGIKPTIVIIERELSNSSARS